ncbi:hypothetical protein DFJ73DRAFT_963490 [Zopfochytrium polystomum]|nr:hypothetical protein DFJ73DRAFT_963490 [Zopfochytrium polystomum]
MKATFATSLALLAAAWAAVVTSAHALDVERGFDRGVLIRRFALSPLRPTIKYTPGRRSMLKPITVYREGSIILFLLPLPLTASGTTHPADSFTILVAPPNPFEAIFYGNWTDADKNLINDFISGIDGSPFWNITAKYYNYNLTDKGEPGPKAYVTSTVKLGKAATDPHRSLGNWLNRPNGTTFDDVMTLVNNVVKSGNLPIDTDGFYLVLTDEQTNEGDSCRSYCGWHNSFFSTQDAARQKNITSGIDYSAPNLKYSWVGNANSCGATGMLHCANRNFFASPNGSPAIDVMLSQIAQALAKASSNPDMTAATTAWNDVVDGVNDGAENGDNCAYLCGPTFPNKVPSDCAKLQGLLPDMFLSDDCCNSGVADCSNGSIIGLDFTGLQLTGSLPDFIKSLNSKFERLETLFLKSNNFSGPLPDAICHQTQLQNLVASYMPNLTGPLPSCLGRMSNLRVLSFHDSPQLTGPIPSTLTSLPHLQYLHVGSCALNGTLPDFSALSDLNYFRADGNRDLTGVLRSGYPGFPGGSSVSQAGSDGVPLRTCDLSGTKGEPMYTTSTVKLGKAAADPSRSFWTWLNGPNATTSEDVLALVNKFVKSGDLPSDTDGFYLVLTDDRTTEGTTCRSYCGWHTSFFGTQDAARQSNITSGIDFSAPNLIYRWVGNAKPCGANGILQCGTCSLFASLNGSPAIDMMLSPIAHELAEASSNPNTTAATTAWNDVPDGGHDGFENGDNCAFVNLRLLGLTHDPQLTGPIPSTLTSLTRLKFLHLGSSAFNGTLPDCSALPDQTFFRADGNRDLAGVFRPRARAAQRVRGVPRWKQRLAFQQRRVLSNCLSSNGKGGEVRCRKKHFYRPQKTSTTHHQNELVQPVARLTFL